MAPRRRPESEVVQRRQKLGLSQYALAKRARISQSHLGKVEKGQIAEPGVRVALAIARGLGLSTLEELECLFGKRAA